MNVTGNRGNDSNAPQSDVKSLGRIYSPRAIFFGAWIGFVVLGYGLLASNYRLFGNRKAAIFARIGGIVHLVLAIMLMFAMNGNSIATAIASFSTYLPCAIAHRTQDRDIEFFLSRGHWLHSAFRTAGWIICSIAIWMALISTLKAVEKLTDEPEAIVGNIVIHAINVETQETSNCVARSFAADKQLAKKQREFEVAPRKQGGHTIFISIKEGGLKKPKTMAFSQKLLDRVKQENVKNGPWEMELYEGTRLITTLR